jgi:hypothetical protein
MARKITQKAKHQLRSWRFSVEHQRRAVHAVTAPHAQP